MLREVPVKRPWPPYWISFQIIFTVFTLSGVMLRTKVDDVDTLNGLYEGQIKGQGSRSPGTKKRKTAESSPIDSA